MSIGFWNRFNLVNRETGRSAPSLKIRAPLSSGGFFLPEQMPPDLLISWLPDFPAYWFPGLPFHPHDAMLGQDSQQVRRHSGRRLRAIDFGQ